MKESHWDAINVYGLFFLLGIIFIGVIVVSSAVDYRAKKITERDIVNSNFDVINTNTRVILERIDRADLDLQSQLLVIQGQKGELDAIKEEVNSMRDKRILAYCYGPIGDDGEPFSVDCSPYSSNWVVDGSR